MNRKFLDLILLGSFLILAVTGIVMYFFPFEKNIASTHTFFALFFLLGVTLHIINNKRPLFKYITGKNESKVKKISGVTLLALLFFLTIGVYYNITPLNSIYNFGNSLRNEQLGIKEETFNYQIIELDKVLGNKNINIEFKKGESFQYPLFAVWLEDTAGKYIETIYVSRAMSSSEFQYVNKVGDDWVPGIVRRPEALPYWSHQRNIQASDGLYIPLNSSPDLDAVTAATPTGNFLVKSKTNIVKGKNYKILLELNQSYDWNDYFTKEKFADDKVYSGSGSVGQPSVIYSAEFTSDELSSTAHKLMKIIGHGHYSGKDGKLYTNLENITTAKKIADRIILSID